MTEDPAAPGGSAPERPECRVLLVEDDAGIGRMLVRGLEAEGYKVDWVRDLVTAVEHARAEPPDLAVLDRMLPDGDGADLCAALRRYGHAIPICMLTARDALEDKLRGFDAGADDYLTKPFEFEELLARLAVLRRRAEGARPEPRYDAETRTIVCGTERVTLTKREGRLLACLIDADGAAVSRARIMEQVWAEAEEVTPNSVDVYVGYVRRKLSKIGDPMRIETLRGEGFRLIR